MDITINAHSCRENFGALRGKSRNVRTESVGSGVLSLYEQDIVPLAGESRESIDKSLRLNTYNFYTSGSTTGIGTTVNHVKAVEQKPLDITRQEYRNYRFFKSNPELTAKVESNLVERGLEEYLNKGFGAKLRKLASRFIG